MKISSREGGGRELMAGCSGRSAPGAIWFGGSRIYVNSHSLILTQIDVHSRLSYKKTHRSLRVWFQRVFLAFERTLSCFLKIGSQPGRSSATLIFLNFLSHPQLFS